MIKTYFNILMLAGCLTCPKWGLADDSGSQYASLEAIYEQAAVFLKQKVDQKLQDPVIDIKTFTTPLKLPACEIPVEIQDRNPTKYAGRMTLGIKCSQPAWQFFLTATVDGKLPAVIATQGILKEAVIRNNDVQKVYLPYKKVPADSLISVEKVIGMRAKKAIAPNDIIIIRDLQPPYWVLKKQAVTLISKIGHIEVKTKGMALEDGVENQQVEVENNNSKKKIKGIVIAPNTVLIP